MRIYGTLPLLKEKLVASSDNLLHRGFFVNLFLIVQISESITQMMASTRLKILVGLILGIVDVSMALWIVVSNPDLRFMAGWVVLNAIAVVVVIVSALAIRNRPLSPSRRRHHFHSSPQTPHARPSKREQSDFRRAYTTTNGEAVKSKGEKLLADYFYQNDIRYQYERPAWATTVDGKFKSRRMISRPDFYLPDYDVYIEYWGMVDTEDESNRADYVKSMKWKMAKYNENKIKFVSIYPKDLGDLDEIFRAKLRESAGTDPDKGMGNNSSFKEF